MSNAIAGALVGALVGAFVTLVLTEWRQARQRVRALMGYTRLLVAEIEANDRVVNELGRHSGTYVMTLPKAKYTPPTIEVWPEISVELAPLIKADEFTLINAYYRDLRVLVNVPKGRALAAERGEPVDDILYRLGRDSREVRSLLSKYTDPPPRARWLGIWAA